MVHALGILSKTRTCLLWLQQHWLKTDFNKWRDEDDSDAEGGDGMQLEDMMKQMGNFNTGDTGPPMVSFL